MAGQLAFYAAATAGSLLVGAALGSFRAPPRTFAVGVTVVEGGSLALLASIVTSNLPEAFGGAAEMRDGGLSGVAFASSAGFLVAYALATVD